MHPMRGSGEWEYGVGGMYVAPTFVLHGSIVHRGPGD